MYSIKSVQKFLRLLLGDVRSKEMSVLLHLFYQKSGHR